MEAVYNKEHNTNVTNFSMAYLIKYKIYVDVACADPESFARGGPTLAIIGPPAKRLMKDSYECERNFK